MAARPLARRYPNMWDSILVHGQHRRCRRARQRGVDPARRRRATARPRRPAGGHRPAAGDVPPPRRRARASPPPAPRRARAVLPRLRADPPRPRRRRRVPARRGGDPPVLEALRDRTGESVQLYVREGDARRCVVSLPSPHALRWTVAQGALLPLGVGSAGRVLLGRPAWRPASRSASRASPRSARPSSIAPGAWSPRSASAVRWSG